MTTNVVTVEPDVDLAHARLLMREHAIQHLVVVDNGHIVGVVSEHDLECVRRSGVHAPPVAAVMCSKVVTVAPEASLRIAADKMRGHDIACLPVVDGKRLAGILTVSDLLGWIVSRPRRRTESGASAAGHKA